MIIRGCIFSEFEMHRSVSTESSVEQDKTFFLRLSKEENKCVFSSIKDLVYVYVRRISIRQNDTCVVELNTLLETLKIGSLASCVHYILYRKGLCNVLARL